MSVLITRLSPASNSSNCTIYLIACYLHILHVRNFYCYCTYVHAGSWFPTPPSNVTIKLGFDYLTGELRLEMISHDLSPGMWLTSSVLHALVHMQSTCNVCILSTMCIASCVHHQIKSMWKATECGLFLPPPPNLVKECKMTLHLTARCACISGALLVELLEGYVYCISHEL